LLASLTLLEMPLQPLRNLQAAVKAASEVQVGAVEEAAAAVDDLPVAVVLYVKKNSTVT
jgi:hypothetical protein